MLGTPVRFDYTGAVQTYTVPANVIGLEVDCVGAAGGTATTCGGYAKGGRVQCKLTVSQNQILYLYIGGKGGDSNLAASTVIVAGGWNGGGGGYINYSLAGHSGGGGGGGASDIRIEGTALSNRKIVAGGAGGSIDGYNYATSSQESWLGGNGGGLIGQDGCIKSGTAGGSAATGGTQSAGGTRAIDFNGYSCDNGTIGQGGNGYAPSDFVGGTGGGGGYYGGGAGVNFYYSGAGGSSYTDPTLCTDVVHTQGYSEATGNGWIILTPIYPDPYNRDTTTDHVITLKLNTTTHNSFLTAGYKYDGSVNGVYLRDMAKIVPSLNIADYNYINTSGDVVLTEYTGTDTVVVMPTIEMQYVE